jgi:hypothetical protein
MFNQYYNGSIKKLVVAFGSLFNNIKVEHQKDGNSVVSTVPLSYAPKEKFIRRLSEPSSISTNTRIQTTLPRMSFEISSIISDPARRLNKLNIKSKYNTDTLINSQTFSEAPYNIMFSLYSYTRTIDDNLQIMEQILPYFNPEFIVSINMNDVHDKVDIPIIINDVSMNELYEGDFSTRRYITSAYKFTAKAYVYGYIKQDTGSIIKEVDYSIFDDKEAPTPDILLDDEQITE